MRSLSSFLLVLVASGLSGLAGCALDDASDDGASEEALNGRRTGTLVSIEKKAVIPGQEITLAIPNGTLGFTVIAESSHDGSLGILSLRDPNGNEALQQFTPASGSSQTALNFSGHIAAAPIPQTDAFGDAPIAGKWTAVVSAYDANGNLVSEPVDVHVRIQKTNDGAFHGGLLDLHVFIPTGLRINDPEPVHAIDAQSAATDRCVAARIDAFFSGLKTYVGIDRGTVTFHAIDASFLEVKSQAALDDLFRTSSAVRDGKGLSFMFANTIETVPGSPTWGVASAVGGAATRMGTAQSGVALAISESFPAYGDGLTMLHETGHFVGLNHTTEIGSDLVDSFADTPSCPNFTPDTMTSCPDHADIMFPLYFGASNGGQGVYFSPAQVKTFRGSPLYRAYTR